MAFPRGLVVAAASHSPVPALGAYVQGVGWYAADDHPHPLGHHHRRGDAGHGTAGGAVGGPAGCAPVGWGGGAGVEGQARAVDQAGAG